MTDLQEAPVLDVDKLMAFVFKAVDEVGATLNTALVVLGDKLGYYRTMADADRSHRAQLASATGDRRALRPGVAQRPGRRRLRRVRRRLPATTPCRPSRRPPSPTRAARPTCPASSRSRSAPRTTRTASSAGGSQPAPGWAGTSTTPTCTTAASGSSAPMYNAHLVGEWLPALDGVVDKLERGATVADVGCGHGASTVIMAQAFPNSTFTGSDYHEASIATARRARQRGRRRRSGDASRSPPRPQFPGAGLRPGDHVRRPARHGRPGRCGPARPRRPRARRHLDGRRADGRRHASATTSTRSGGPTTASPPCCARRRRWPRRSAWRSAPRPGRPGSATWSRRAASRGSGPLPQTPFNRVLEIRP